MQNLDLTAEELFNKIRGRFPSVTIGDEEGNVTNEPKLARYFDFNFMNEGRPVGKVSISLDNKAVAVVYGEDLVANETELTRNNWYDFLKELRMFAKKRALTFDTRDITKSNLNSRDYKFLATNRGGDKEMNESKMYGTSRVSYQDFDGARLMIKHTESIDQEAPGGRAKKVGGLYIESAEGERFKYPYKHLTGARAMARHVAEGGNAYDDFGKHIVSMSEEMNKLRKFKTYMGRSAVMAESLSEYVDVVKERIATVKKTLESLQRPAYYKEAFEGFEVAVMEDVPADVAENWIDQLTIRQFNEELADVFPYIYKLVSEATKAEELRPEDLVDEGERHGNDKMYDKCWDGYKKVPGKKRGEKGSCVKEEDELEELFNQTLGQFSEAANDCDETCPKSCPDCGGTGDPEKYQAMQKEADEKCEDCGCSPCECDEDTDEGNAYAHAVRKAKMDGKKKGDKVQGPDGDEITLEKDQKTPLGEFILSYYDRETGEFPKGETAVLTMIEKDYGEQYIEPAKQFIEKINQVFDEHMIASSRQTEDEVTEFWDDEEEDSYGGDRRIQDNGNTTNFNIDKSKPKSKWKYLGKEYTIYADEDEIEMFLKGDYSKGWERQDKGAKTHALGDEPAGDPDSAMFKGASTFPLKKKEKGKMKPLMPEPGEPGYPEEEMQRMRELAGLR
jgi:hypothetical protein